LFAFEYVQTSIRSDSENLHQSDAIGSTRPAERGNRQRRGTITDPSLADSPTIDHVTGNDRLQSNGSSLVMVDAARSGASILHNPIRWHVLPSQRSNVSPSWTRRTVPTSSSALAIAAGHMQAEDDAPQHQPEPQRAPVTNADPLGIKRSACSGQRSLVREVIIAPAHGSKGSELTIC
jgi:hypothetical protein